MFDPKESSLSSAAAKGNYFDQPSREKEVTAKGETFFLRIGVATCMILVTS